MDDRILHDPHLELIPDHAGPHYDILRNALTQNGMTIDQAVQALNDSWTQNHDARVQAWDQQVANNAQALLNQALPNQDQAPQPEEERAEVDKKKLKMKDFDDAVAVGNYIAPRQLSMPYAALKTSNTLNSGTSHLRAARMQHSSKPRSTTMLSASRGSMTL